MVLGDEGERGVGSLSLKRNGNGPDPKFWVQVYLGPGVEETDKGTATHRIPESHVVPAPGRPVVYKWKTKELIWGNGLPKKCSVS